jgi:hypothetical protein
VPEPSAGIRHREAPANTNLCRRPWHPDAAALVMGHVATEIRQRLDAFFELCRTSLDPKISKKTAEEMLVQHLLTERLFRTIFDNPEFTRRNAEIILFYSNIPTKPQRLHGRSNRCLAPAVRRSCTAYDYYDTQQIRCTTNLLRKTGCAGLRKFRGT